MWLDRGLVAFVKEFHGDILAREIYSRGVVAFAQFQCRADFDVIVHVNILPIICQTVQSGAVATSNHSFAATPSRGAKTALR